MKKAVMLLAVVATIAVSCNGEKEKPKVIYENSAKPKEVSAKAQDTTSVVIAVLPVQITGTDYLVHPLGDLRVNEASRESGSSGSSGVSYSISNYGEFEITGYLRNLKFQQIGSDSLSVLTDKPVLIQTATFLKPLADRTKLQLFVYTLSDADTNKDGKIDASDIETLYVSTIGGERFTKLSPDMQELIDWKLIESKNRLYFRTIEDANKNGAFDKDDIVHYNYVDLAGKEWTVTAYKPI
jgi:hypothetical protein